MQGTMRIGIVNSGSERPVATETVRVAQEGKKFFTERRRHFEALTWEDYLGELGFSRESFRDVTFLERLSYDGVNTYQFANANSRGHVFTGKHNMTRGRTGLDSLLFTEPYRGNYWDDLLLADRMCCADQRIALRLEDCGLDTVAKRRCLYLALTAGGGEEYGLIRAWFDLERGGLPLQIEHWQKRAGLALLMQERLDGVRLKEVATDLFMPTELRRTCYGFNANAAVTVEQVTTVHYDDVAVNQPIDPAVFRSAVPAGAYVWREADDSATEGAGSDGLVPVGRRVRIPNTRCSNTRVNCSTSPCSSGPTRPLSCLICNGGVVVVPCVTRQFVNCDATAICCGTFEAGSCNFFGSCTGRIVGTRPCVVFDC